MTKSDTNTASVVNLNTTNFPYREIINLEDSITALSDYSNLESEQKLLALVAKACRKDFEILTSKILADLP